MIRGWQSAVVHQTEARREFPPAHAQLALALAMPMPTMVYRGIRMWLHGPSAMAATSISVRFKTSLTVIEGFLENEQDGKSGAPA